MSGTPNRGRSRSTLDRRHGLDRIADGDPSRGHDVGPQPAAVDQRPQRTPDGDPVEMGAWLAQPLPLALNPAYAEVPPD